GPPSKSRLRDWLLESIIQAESEAEVIPQFGKRGQAIKPKVVKSEWEGKLRGILGHMSRNDGYNPWARITPEMDQRFGRAPRKGIRWVEEGEALQYACQDASDALELALLFDRMRQEIVGVRGEWHILEEDRDDVGIPRESLCLG